MAMTVGGCKTIRAEINMTPLIDVLLVLIIIFMVITPLTPRGLETLVPQPAPSTQPAVVRLRDVVISVDRDGTIRVNRQQVAVERLEDFLRSIFKHRPGDVIFVRGDRSLEFHQVARVIDVARGAGVDRVALMTLPY